MKNELKDAKRIMAFIYFAGIVIMLFLFLG